MAFRLNAFPRIHKPTEKTMAKILVLYYSSWGHMEKMAKAAAEGAREAGADVTIKRVRELVPEDVAKAAYYKLDQDAPIAEPLELDQYDGIILGVSTRFGGMAAQIKNRLSAERLHAQDFEVQHA